MPFSWNSKLFFAFCLLGVASGELERLLFIFRHGDRTTDKPLFPTDPNVGEITNGKGDITAEGKIQGYNLGKKLRELYPTFITNDSNEVSARSSDYGRTITTVGCVFTGMYTPEKNESCLNGKDFPITILSVPKDRDYMLSTGAVCPAMVNETEKMKNSTAAHDYFEENNETISMLANFTGYKSIDDYKTVYNIYDNLFIEKIHNLTWNSWVEPMWPEIVRLADEETFLQYQTNTSLRLTAGALINEIVEKLHVANNSVTNMTLNIGANTTVTTNTTDKKVFLYGTHNYIITALMMSLEVYNGMPVPYVGTFVVELHQDSTVRFLYLNSTDKPAITIPLPQCQKKEYCPVEEFVTLAKPFTVANPEKECGNSGSMTVAFGVLVMLCFLILHL